jgi:hypothetical protein
MTSSEQSRTNIDLPHRRGVVYSRCEARPKFGVPNLNYIIDSKSPLTVAVRGDLAGGETAGGPKLLTALDSVASISLSLVLFNQFE